MSYIFVHNILKFLLHTVETLLVLDLVNNCSKSHSFKSIDSVYQVYHQAVVLEAHIATQFLYICETTEAEPLQPQYTKNACSKYILNVQATFIFISFILISTALVSELSIVLSSANIVSVVQIVNMLFDLIYAVTSDILCAIWYLNVQGTRLIAQGVLLK